MDAAPEEERDTKKSTRRKLRNRKCSDPEMDQNDHEDDMSEEEEESYCFERVVGVTTKPPITQLAGDGQFRQPPADLNSQANEFTPQVPRMLPEEVQSDLQVNVHESVIEMENHADNYPATSPAHVIIDIPEPDMQNPPSQPEEQTPEPTEQAQDKPESEQSHTSAINRPVSEALSAQRPLVTFMEDELAPNSQLVREGDMIYGSPETPSEGRGWFCEEPSWTQGGTEAWGADTGCPASHVSVGATFLQLLCCLWAGLACKKVLQLHEGPYRGLAAPSTEMRTSHYINHCPDVEGTPSRHFAVKKKNAT
ncbi:hypothetical protein N1851_030216 [Merluccius polli]|uniref:Uncharacterized protein n=1 Tax=Merluccius polli TaxID=89951 RepID=A0AA47M5V2_MERPO|nr:hypothetical protein N1851_030216 [Merluccius polli]